MGVCRKPSIRIRFRRRRINVVRWGVSGLLGYVLYLRTSGIMLGNVLYLWSGRILDLGRRVLDLLGSGRGVMALNWSSRVRYLRSVWCNLVAGISFANDLGEQTEVGIGDMWITEVKTGNAASWRVMRLMSYGWGVGGWSGDRAVVGWRCCLVSYGCGSRVLNLKKENINEIWLVSLCNINSHLITTLEW